MPILPEDVAFRRAKIGMPDEHAKKFKEIARDLKCVILCRAVGPTCLQLLEQGYDTKGFRVHAKSCDWGPMAGFVLRDPRLNKSGSGKEEFNRNEHHHALDDTTGSGWRAGTTHLKLYPDRVDWLRNKGLITLTHENANKVTERWVGEAIHGSGVRFYYALFRELSGGQHVYAVYFDAIKNHNLFRQEVSSRPPLRQYRFEPMMAMTNPHKSWPEEDFRNAITGDYDLFGVWPFERDYDPDDMDRRLLGTAHVISQSAAVDTGEADFTRVGGRAQGTKIGNITNRIYMVCQFLNSAIGIVSSAQKYKTFGPFPNRMVCWHSDEAARPGVMDVDLPIIAFTPHGRETYITSIPEFKNFIKIARKNKIHVTLAEGWTRDPDDKYANRLGSEYAGAVPRFEGGAWTIPDWYNK